MSDYYEEEGQPIAILEFRDQLSQTDIESFMARHGVDEFKIMLSGCVFFVASEQKLESFEKEREVKSIVFERADEQMLEEAAPKPRRALNNEYQRQ